MRTRQASATFVLATVALDALSFAIVLPVTPGLIREVGHLTASRASFWAGTLFASYSLTQFVCAPVLGGLSDRFGRRPVLLGSLTGLLCMQSLMVWAPSLTALLLIRLGAGAMSGNIAAATAYIADVTTPEQRAGHFGLVGAMFGLGFVVGPAIGGLLGHHWIRLPFLASAAMMALNVLYGFVVLPESLPPERRRAFSWRRANPLGSLSLLAASRGTALLGLVWCLSWCGLAAQMTSFILANQIRFGWSPLENGMVLAVGGLTQALVQGVLVRRVTAAFGARRTALAGFACAVLGYLLYTAAVAPWLMLAGLIALSFAALASPTVQSMLSLAAGPTRQGEVQGTLSSIQGLTLIVAPLVTGGLFNAATRPGTGFRFAGAPFLLAALASAGAWLLIRALPCTVTEPAAAPEPARVPAA